MTQRRDYIDTTIATVRQHSRDSQSWWVGAAHGLADEVECLRTALEETRPYVFNRITLHPIEQDWRSETALEVLARIDAALGGEMWR